MTLEDFLPKLKVFIFDMDGTLVDSRLDFDRMREELGFPQGVPLLEHIDSIKDQTDEKTLNYYFEVIHRHELEGARNSELMPGVREFLHFLEEFGVKTAVLTRNNLEVTELTFSKWNLNFSQVLSRDCVTRPKPHPEGLLKICQELEANPYEAVYMGDFLFDLEAAHNAGMKAILYTPKEQELLTELDEKADVTVRCFKTLKDTFSESFLRPLGFSVPNL